MIFPINVLIKNKHFYARTQHCFEFRLLVHIIRFFSIHFFLLCCQDQLIDFAYNLTFDILTANTLVSVVILYRLRRYIAYFLYFFFFIRATIFRLIAVYCSSTVRFVHYVLLLHGFSQGLVWLF